MFSSLYLLFGLKGWLQHILSSCLIPLIFSKELSKLTCNFKKSGTYVNIFMSRDINFIVSFMGCL